jgi:DNA-directed RNA polymerase sigma subunit (sigma70/sigma32)
MKVPLCYKRHESLISEYRVMKNMTYDQLAVASNCRTSAIIGFNNGTMSPIRNNGEVRTPAKRISDALNVSLETLFPKYINEIELSNSKEILPEQHLDISISNGSVKMTNEIKTVCIKQILQEMKSQLTEFEQYVIFHRFWLDQTCEEIGKDRNVTKSYINAVEQRCLQKLRRFAKRNNICLNEEF